jgi:hypothetical protein
MLTSLLSSQAACSLQYALHLDSAVKPTLLTSRSKSAPRPSALIRLDLSSSKEMAETSAIAPDVPDNAPKGDLCITSKRGEIIHLRCYVPDDPAAIKAVLFFFHGYTGHSSSLPKRTLAKVGFCTALALKVSRLQLARALEYDMPTELSCIVCDYCDQSLPGLVRARHCSHPARLDRAWLQ